MKDINYFQLAPDSYYDCSNREGRFHGVILNISFIILLATLSYSYLQLMYSATVILGLGVIGVWRHSWGLTNFFRALIYQKRTSIDNENFINPAHNLIVIATFYNQTSEEVSAVSKCLSISVSSLPSRTLLICAFLREDQKVVITNQFKENSNVVLRFVQQFGLGKREALADALLLAKKSVTPSNEKSTSVLLIDGDTLVTERAITQSIIELQNLTDLGAVIVNEIPFCKSTKLFAQWRMLRSLERNKLMSSFALSGRVLVLTGRFCMYRADVILKIDVINRIRRDYLRLNNLHISLLTGDDKTTWLEVVRRKMKMKYLPFCYIHPIEAENQNKNSLRNIFELTSRYSGNMARANLHRDAWVEAAKTPHFAYGLFDQRISMWTSLLTPLLLIYLLLFDHFGIFIIALTYALIIKNIQAFGLWVISGVYDPWYPYLILYNQVLTAIVKIRAFGFLHQQSWTNQGIESDKNIDTVNLDRQSTSSIMLRSTIFVCLFSVIYFLLR